MRIMILLLVCASICACDHSASSINIGVLSEVKEVYLSDGTLCAVFDGANRGGITCNWDRK